MSDFAIDLGSANLLAKRRASALAFRTMRGNVVATAGAALAGLLLAQYGSAQEPSMRRARLQGADAAACPAPKLARVCPCTGEAPPRRFDIRIDMSASVLPAEPKPRDDYCRNVNLTKEGLDRAVRKYAAKYGIPTPEVRTFAFSQVDSRLHSMFEPGAVCPPSTDNTDIVTLGLAPPLRPATVVLITDGYHSPGKKHASCKQLRTDAQGALLDWLETYPKSDIRLLLSTGIDECVHETDPIECPKDSPRCRQASLNPDNAGTDFWRNVLETAVPPPRQRLPSDPADATAIVGDDRSFTCSGALIGPRHVLTAAHCLPASRVAFRGRATDSSPLFRVRATRKHPTLDVALLELDRPVLIEPLARRRVEDVEPPQGGLRFVGFGKDVAGTDFGKRKSIELQASGWGCDQRRARSGCIAGEELIVPGVGGADTCAGDSGGPLLELTTDGERCFWRLVGTTSRSVADGRSACGSGGIYVRTDRISLWLDEALGKAR